MTRLAAILAIGFGTQLASGHGQSPSATRNPPPTVVSRAWQMIAAEGPIGTDEFTSVSVNWTEGAYYMIVSSDRQRRSKIMLTPPIGENGWRIQILQPDPEFGKTKQAGQRKPNPKPDTLDPRMAWTRSYAKALTGLPEMFAEVKSYQVRAIPEKDHVVFFLETTSSIKAWITFKVGSSGKFEMIDRGF